MPGAWPFCGPTGCCGINTSISDDSLTYESFDNIDSLPKTYKCRSSSGVDEIVELSDCETIETDDGSGLMTWTEDDLCDSHLNSLRQRRESYSMSNILDMNDDQCLADKTCTYPPSRSKSTHPWFTLIPKHSCKTNRRRGVMKESLLNDCRDDHRLLTESTFSSSQGLIFKDNKEDIPNKELSAEISTKCPLCAK